MDGYKIGVSSFTFNYASGTIPSQRPEVPMTPFELLKLAKDLTAELVQFGDNMPLEHVPEEDLFKIREMADEMGLILEVGMRKGTAERIRKYIHISQILRSEILRIVWDGVGEFEPSIDEICEIIEEVLPNLEAANIVLAIENHDRLKACEFEEIARRMDNPHVGLTVDTTNSLSIEEPVDVVLKHMAPYCACLHVKDYDIVRNRGGIGLKIIGACPGEGRQNIELCVKTCKELAKRKFNLVLESWMEPCQTLEESRKQEVEWARRGIQNLREILLKS